MKANKALKRLSKIETLMSVVSERYSAGESHIREMLQDAKAAVARVKEAVSLQASSVKAKKPAKPKRKAGQEAPRRRRAHAKAAVAKPARATTKVAPARKKAAVKKATAVKKAAVKPRTAKTAKKNARVGRATVAKKTASAPAQAPQQPMPAQPELNDRSDSAYGL